MLVFVCLLLFCLFVCLLLLCLFVCLLLLCLFVCLSAFLMFALARLSTDSTLSRRVHDSGRQAGRRHEFIFKNCPPPRILINASRYCYFLPVQFSHVVQTEGIFDAGVVFCTINGGNATLVPYELFSTNGYNNVVDNIDLFGYNPLSGIAEVHVPSPEGKSLGRGGGEQRMWNRCGDFAW